MRLAERLPVDRRNVRETLWEPDEGERRALVNGASLRLVTVDYVPSDSDLRVGEPPEGKPLIALYDYVHVRRAFGYFQLALAKQIRATGQFGFTAQQIDVLCSRSLTASASRPPNFEGELVALDNADAVEG